MSDKCALCGGDFEAPIHSCASNSHAFVKYFPGEQEAIAEVVRLADLFGYGNLISRLKDAWSLKLQKDYGFEKAMADRGALHVCPWCHVDGRTGKQVK